MASSSDEGQTLQGGAAPAMSDKEQAQDSRRRITAWDSLPTDNVGRTLPPKCPGHTDSEEQTHHQLQSRLFQLPKELRIQIYEHVLRIDSGDKPVLLLLRNPRRTPLTRLTVLSTCRRVLIEAEPIFYQVNRACLQRPGDFISALCLRRRLTITFLALRAGDITSLTRKLKHMHRLPNLTSLHIHPFTKMTVHNTQGYDRIEALDELVDEIKRLNLTDFKVVLPAATNEVELRATKHIWMEEIAGRLILTRCICDVITKGHISGIHKQT